MKLKPENIHWLNEFKDFFNKSTDELRRELSEALDLLAYLNETLVEEKINVEKHEVLSEALVLKFFFHGQSVVNISKGYSLTSKYFNKEKFEKNKFIDLSSLLSVCRAQLECLLMYQHIYINPKNTDEEKLRYYAWIYTALLKRKNIPAHTDETKLQKEKDEIQMKELKVQIVDCESYKLLSQKQQISLLENGSGKLFKHWDTIFKESNYDGGLFTKLYYMLSTYSHSEGLSAIQLQTVKYNYETKKNQESAFLQILSSLIITCRMIINVTNRFPAIEKRYNGIEEKTRYLIHFYSQIGKTDKKPIA